MKGMVAGKPHRLTDEVSVQELMEYRREGLTNKEIAELLEVHPATIIRYIGRGVSNAPTRNRGIDTGEVLKKVQSGMSTREIAHELGVSMQTVNYHLKKARAQSVQSPVLSPEQYAACKAHIEAKKAEAEPPKPKNRLKIENVVTRVTGEAGGYTIDQSKREVSIDRGVWKFDELAALLGDSEAIRQEVRA